MYNLAYILFSLSLANLLLCFVRCFHISLVLYFVFFVTLISLRPFLAIFVPLLFDLSRYIVDIQSCSSPIYVNIILTDECSLYVKVGTFQTPLVMSIPYLILCSVYVLFNSTLRMPFQSDWNRLIIYKKWTRNFQQSRHFCKTMLC